MSDNAPIDIHSAAAALGAKGGKKGVKNPKKARDPETARAAARTRWDRYHEAKAKGAAEEHRENVDGSSADLPNAT